jgi:hypothetical protein
MVCRWSSIPGTNRLVCRWELESADAAGPSQREARVARAGSHVLIDFYIERSMRHRARSGAHDCRR